MGLAGWPPSLSLPAAGPLAANSEWLGEVTAVGRKDPVWGRVAQSGRGITEGGRACVPPSCRAKKGQASVQPSSSSQQGCQALHSCHHTASPQPRGDMWPPSARVAGGEVTLEPGGHHTVAMPGPRLCAFPCHGPLPGAGLQGTAGGEGWGPAPKASRLGCGKAGCYQMAAT